VLVVYLTFSDRFLVSETAVVDPKLAPIVGFATGALYVQVSNLMIFLEIDDPVDAAAVHITGGVTGLLAVALLADGGQLLSLYGTGEDCGVLSMRGVEWSWCVLLQQCESRHRLSAARVFAMQTSPECWWMRA